MLGRITEKFWREVNRVRVKTESERWGIKDNEGREVMGREKEREMWGRYFIRLLNEGSEDRTVVDGEWEEELRGVGNVEEGRGITMTEVEGAIKKLKKGKAAGSDGIM